MSGLVAVVAACCPAVWTSCSVFNRSPVGGILDYSQFMAIMNKAAMSISILLMLQPGSVSLKEVPGNRVTGEGLGERGRARVARPARRHPSIGI